MSATRVLAKAETMPSMPLNISTYREKTYDEYAHVLNNSKQAYSGRGDQKTTLCAPAEN
jgi:hypothetical protein